jgi:DNA polymerase elongation subunit (family B)
MREEKIFTYAFHVESEKEERNENDRKCMFDVCSIRIYGLDKDNNTVCVKVKDFQPYCYIELQRLHMGPWTDHLLIDVKDYLCSLVGRNKPVRLDLVYRKRLYSNETEKYPFLKCTFRVKRDMYILRKEMSKAAIIDNGLEKHELYVGNGIKKLQFKFHETKAGEILQLVCERDLPTAGWMRFKGSIDCEKETLADREYTVSKKSLRRCEIEDEPCASVSPLVMSFDIEAYSHNPCKFPDAEHPEDKVFMISCVFFRAGDDKIVREVLLTLGNPDECIVGCECVPYKNEAGLLEGFADLLRDMNPHIITGYNIMSFDIDYMIKRSAGEAMCEAGFQAGGMHKDRLAEKKTMKWSSSAYKNQEFSYLNYEGRIFIDLLPVVRRDYNKLRNYKLSTVSQHFINSDKEDLPVKELFACYKVGVLDEEKDKKLASRELGKAGKYCMVDSRLVARLFNKLNIWYGASEMAKTCNIPIFDLSTRGQQIRVYSQVYKHCLKAKVVVQENGYVAKEGERYVGAYVFQPKAGAYDNIVPFDFASLYPTIIIAYNIDFSTLVTNPRIPDRYCHVIEWADHLGCEHDKNVVRVKQITKFINESLDNLKKMRKRRDTLKLSDFYPSGVKKGTKAIRERASKLREKRRKQINRDIKKKEKEIKPYREERAELKKSIPKRVMCGNRRYRFLKSPKGVIPTILQNMLDARANTRKVIKKNAKIMDHLEGVEKDDLVMTNKILHQRQLAYKVCCNSMYGAMGVRDGYLPFMPGAMCTTAMGRKNNILAANTIVEKWKGKLVYGDSVTGDTPVMIKESNGMVNIVTIETLANGEYEPYDQFKADQSNRREKQQAQVDVRVWADGVWADVNRVIRHKTKKRIFRVLTHTGCVDVTEDHSLLDASGRKLKPVDAKVGQELLHAFPDEFCGTCTDISTEEAFAMGFFFGDGSCGTVI